MTFMPVPTDFSPTSELIDLPPDSRGEAWTDENVIQLARLVREEGLTNAEIGERMGRSALSVQTAISRFGARDPRAKLRTCLSDRCRGQRVFFSLSVGNRICGRCAPSMALECA